MCEENRVGRWRMDEGWACVKLLVALALTSSSILLGQGLSITMSSSPVRSGDTIVLSYGATDTGSRRSRAAGPFATWTLQGPGALHGPLHARSIEYTAPTTTIPNHEMNGCGVLPNDAVFNTKIYQLPADPNSAQKLNSVYALTQSSINFETSWGISHADPITPTRTLRSYYDSVLHDGFPIATGPLLKREGGNRVGIFSFLELGNNAPDHHVLTVRQPDCAIFETYDDYTDGYTRACRDSSPNCSVQSAVRYDPGTYKIQGGTDAAGFLLAPLTWHLDEIKKGELLHGTRFTNNGIFLYNSSIWPAASTAGGTAACTPTSCLQLGDRLRLRSDFKVSGVCNSQVSEQDRACRALLTGLQNYGMFLADTGTTNAIQIADDVSQDTTTMAALLAIQNSNIRLTPANFEVVDESSLEVSPNSYQTCPYGHQCMGETNSFVSPQDQVIITATPLDGPPASIDVPLQGMAIGLGVPTKLPVVAASYEFGLPAWIDGAVNPGLTWSIESGVGSILANGTYTPPSDTSGGSSAVLVAVSDVNPNVYKQVYVTVLPRNPTSGALKIDVGSLTSTVDELGNLWLPDPGMDGVDVGRMVQSDYPNWLTNNPERVIYQSRDGSQNDIRIALAIPNGNYLVHLLFGLLYDGSGGQTSWLGEAFDAYSFGPLLIETQGDDQRTFDFGIATAYQYATPADVYVPAKVSNNLLQIGILGYAPDTGPNSATAKGNKINTLNGIEITLDESAPHWVIDSQQQDSIRAGESLQLSVIDFYTGSKAATWSLHGPGSIDQNGLLSVPAGSYTAGTSIVVFATSTNDPGISASLSLNLAVP